MTKKKATMTLKDFHGGSIPSDLPLPSAPGVMARPLERSGFDSQTSWGNSMGRHEHRLRPGSAGATRNFDDKTPFLGHNAHIGRNFDEDERKPLDGASGPRRTVSDESIRALPSHVESKADYSANGMVGSRPVSAPVSQSSVGAASGSFVTRFSETTNVRLNSQSLGRGSHMGGSPANVSGNSGQALVTESYPNAWGLRKEVASVKESVSAPWSAPDAELKLAHASALEKVSSGRWHSKQQIHSQMDAEVIKHEETQRGYYNLESSAMYNNNTYNTPEVAGGTEYSDQALAVNAERNLTLGEGVHGFSKELQSRVKAGSPLYMESNERKASVNVDGFRRSDTVVSSKGYGLQLPAPSEPSERPKLKLLPRSKPLENTKQSVDYKQVNQQPSGPVHIETLCVSAPSSNPIRPVFFGAESGNQAVERPKFSLNPSSQPLEQVEGKTDSKRNILFGGARPRELVLNDRGLNDAIMDNQDLHQPALRSKQHTAKTETIPIHAARFNENSPNNHRMGKNTDRREHRVDVEKADVQRRNWRNREVEKHRHHHLQQHPQERQPSPETWRKPVEPAKPASPDAPAVRYGKAASAVELAAAFSRSGSNPSTTDRFSGQRRLPNQGQIPFSRLTGPSPRPQINGY